MPLTVSNPFRMSCVLLLLIKRFERLSHFPGIFSIQFETPTPLSQLYDSMLSVPLGAVGSHFRSDPVPSLVVPLSRFRVWYSAFTNPLVPSERCGPFPKVFSPSLHVDPCSSLPKFPLLLVLFASLSGIFLPCSSNMR